MTMKYFVLTSITSIVCFFSALAQNNIPDSTKKKLDALIEAKLLKPVREQKNKLTVGDFARAYSTTNYVYDVYKTPSGKDNYYLCVFKEMKGAFITEKVEFRADIKKESILMFDEKTKKFIPVEKWLEGHDKKE